MNKQALDSFDRYIIIVKIQLKTGRCLRILMSQVRAYKFWFRSNLVTP